ncbi:uncharacterized protein Z519_04523 [Cladophialophora bantiana CBS 173.52]|uniref:GA4 desaturase family protein n=1 Tax=Cladophialophora bantiana (strain ATCC 10958 / CBS 173.52 / CDC B-1940 / NIH 8579) TaxID=1442370 RepID=A0A0D2G7F9_CLAB1|nr:uncharacterized protein Z519_04523 [Cladophialophora bantiana CBS 173.52]KIW94547.1 hypothetical protein Z519_04523 [Cladophialophora bantiana CBS 173.52]
MAIKDSFLANGTTHVVQSTLNYYLDPSKGGVKEFYPSTAGAFRRKHDPHPIQIADIGGFEEEFNLDKQGFAILQHETEEKQFTDDEEVKERLFSEITELLKRVTGATQVRPFSHLVRRDRWEDAQRAWEGKEDHEVIRKKVPARFAHVDHSYVGAEQILRDNLPDEEERERLTKTRWAIINAWRPIREVTRDPLAVCDARTVEDSDLVGVTAHTPPPESGSVEGVSKGNNFETWLVKANPAHRWYYKSHMTPQDVLLLKIFDSKKDGRARRVPHTSFYSEEDYGDPRTSVEIRCMVFWENESRE